VVFVTAYRSDLAVYIGLDSLFSYGPSYGSNSTLYPFGFSDTAITVGYSVYSEGYLSSSGLCISLSPDQSLCVLS
jgi:hypothetical protein